MFRHNSSPGRAAARLSPGFQPAMAPAQPSSSREADHARRRVDAGSAHRREQFCSLSFKLQPRVLMRAMPGHSIDARSEEHTSELQSLMRISYAVFCLKKKTNNKIL